MNCKVPGVRIPHSPLQSVCCRRRFSRFVRDSIPFSPPLLRSCPQGHADSASLHRVPPGRRIAPPSRHAPDGAIASFESPQPFGLTLLQAPAFLRSQEESRCKITPICTSGLEKGGCQVQTGPYLHLCRRKELPRQGTRTETIERAGERQEERSLPERRRARARDRQCFIRQ